MLLRSSSTPVLGSLLPSFSDSPNNNCNHYETNTIIKHPPTTIHQNHNRHSFHQTGSLNYHSISPSIADLNRNKGFRRAQSEGNLEGLAYASCNSSEDQYIKPSKFSGRPKSIMLQTIPSFSFYNLKGELEDGEEEEESDIEDDKERVEVERVMAMGAQIQSLENKMNNMILTEEVNVKDDIWNMGFDQETFLARGLGIGSGDGGGSGGGGGCGSGGEFNSAGSGGDGEDKRGVEEYYKRMVEENPGNPLFLRNYAQFLYQSKRDLQSADEYYSRAILADPKDGEILSQYAKLVWELHHDQDRASSYFERAVQASPKDSHVHAAYASFLWETEEYGGECDVPKDLKAMSPHFHGTAASASA
uniref:TmcB/TmcC TPR repeats domain-containing protein n=1 Tax=Fagus sylvatica TaxID=28930 RepID=A0A2N9IKE4_FAGSY